MKEERKSLTGMRRRLAAIVLAAVFCCSALIFTAAEPDSVNAAQEAQQGDIKVKITAYGLSRWVSCGRMSVRDIMTAEEVPVGVYDRTEPALDEVAADGQEIRLYHITTRKIAVREKSRIPKKTVKDRTMLRGEKRILRQGQNGLDYVKYDQILADGHEVDRVELDRRVLEKPVAQVTAVGTMYRGLDYKGTEKRFNISRKYDVKATAYCDSGYTAGGPAAGDGIIAVDPDVIPLGTKVFVEGYGFAICADTGGAIKGKKIDIWLPDENKCESWGVRDTVIYILDDQDAPLPAVTHVESDGSRPADSSGSRSQDGGQKKKSPEKTRDHSQQVEKQEIEQDED
ncbi:MAG: 3D domain-containing protein [Anaerovoracaceae bacterium]|jgi:3D (Asp-Asp-Asp) domain-containing protein